MLQLLLMAVGTYLGIMFCIGAVSIVFRDLGVFGLIILAVCALLGLLLVASGDKNKRDK